MSESIQTESIQTETIHSNRLLTHPVAAVWAQLTDPERVSRWLMPTDLRAEVGASFTFDTGRWGKVSCQVLEVVPERLLRFSWRNGALDTVVSWRLEPEGEHTRLFIEHSGFDAQDPAQRFALDGMRAGWSGAVVDRLVAELGR